MAKKRDIKEILTKLWQTSQKDFEKITKETSKLLKKGEEALKEVSQKSKEKLELVSLTLKRERLYYRLGKLITTLPKSSWEKSKKINALVKEITNLTRQIKKLKK